MAGEAVRSLFAEVGWKIDSAPLQKLDKLLDEIKQSMLGGAIDEFEKDIRQVGKASNETGKSVSHASKEVKGLGQSVGKTGQNIKQFDQKTSQSGRALRTLGTSIRSVSQHLRQATNNFESLRVRADAAINSIGRGLRRLATAPFTMPGAILGGTIGYGSYRLGTESLQLAGEKENSLLAMSFFNGSEERGKSAYDELVKFAALTPYELPFVREQATGLMGLYKGMQGDNFNADKMLSDTMRSLTAFGDAAGLTGAGENGATMALLGFRQIGTIGKLQLEELRQVTENLLIPMELVRKELGLTKEEMGSIGDMNIPAEEAMEAILRALEKNFGGGMEKLSETYLGMQSTIRDTARIGVSALGEGMADPIKDIMRDIIGTTDYTSDSFKRFQDKVRNFGRGVGNILKSFYTDVKKYIGQAAEYINTRYINNLEFQNLDLKGKIDFVFADIRETFNKWYANGGRDAIQRGMSEIVSLMASSLESAIPTFASIGVQLGSALIKGLLDAVKNDPFASALLGGAGGAAVGGLGGPGGTALGAVVGATAGATNAGVEVAKESVGRSNWMNDLFDWTNQNLPTWMGGMRGKPQSEIDAYNANRRNKLQGVDGSHADGLSYVPKDGYIAELHEGERVLTADENRTYSAQRGTSSSSTGKGSNIRVEITNNIQAGSNSKASEIAGKVSTTSRDAIEGFFRSLNRTNPQIWEV